MDAIVETAAALAEKVIVIIGGTSGLGLSATKACVRAGAKVVAVGLPGQDAVLLEDTLLEDGCLLATGDARDPATAESAIARAVEKFGAFHALYHVAGGSGRRAWRRPACTRSPTTAGDLRSIST